MKGAEDGLLVRECEGETVLVATLGQGFPRLAALTAQQDNLLVHILHLGGKVLLDQKKRKILAKNAEYREKGYLCPATWS